MVEPSDLSLDAAMAILGVESGATKAQARAAYRRALRRAHPDSSGASSSPHRSGVPESQVVVVAWRLVANAFAGGDRLQPAESTAAAEGSTAHRRAAPGPGEPAGPAPASSPAVNAQMVANDGIWIDCSRHETVALVVEALHSLGDVTYADDTSGVFEAVVEFVDAPLCSVVCTLQGRAIGAAQTAAGSAGGTEIMVSVEAISRPDAPQVPPIDGVTQLLCSTIREAAATSV